MTGGPGCSVPQASATRSLPQSDRKKRGVGTAEAERLKSFWTLKPSTQPFFSFSCFFVFVLVDKEKLLLAQSFCGWERAFLQFI